MATSVLPSPVRISAIFPSCKAIPPISCTSKWRMPSARTPASRTTANASGRSWSSDSPSAIRDRNSSVLARNAASSSACMASSSALIRATTLPIRFSSRSLRVPKIFFTVEISMESSLLSYKGILMDDGMSRRDSLVSDVCGARRWQDRLLDRA